MAKLVDRPTSCILIHHPEHAGETEIFGLAITRIGFRIVRSAPAPVTNVPRLSHRAGPHMVKNWYECNTVC